MAIHPDFPTSPHAILNPDIRWFPADEALRETSYEKLLPPLVHELRKKVRPWRESGYEGASDTSIALLNWWFAKEHLLPNADGTMSPFQYYYAQQEAVETVIYLYDTVGVKDKYDLLRFDSSGAVSAGMFDEQWRRFVIKMATGSGKTKVMSLMLAWCYFHKLYEPQSDLARNFLVIAPNIIVLDRIRADFDGLKIFFRDPVLPDNGYEGRNWRDNFQLTLHIQDDVNITRKTGNIFLTNIHRVYAGNDSEPGFDNENTAKDFDRLDIRVPILTARIYRNYKNLDDLQPETFAGKKIEYRQFSQEEQREIVFKDITTGEISHTTVLDPGAVMDYRSVIGYFTQMIMKDLLLVSGYDVLYGKVKEFIRNYLFDRQIEIDDLNTLRNLSELGAARTVIETFKKKINELTIEDKGSAEIKDYIKAGNTRPFVVKEQGYLIPTKSVFNKIIGDSLFELDFASFLESCDDVVSYVKNYLAVNFRIDYVNAHGDVSNYYHDFIVKKSDSEYFVVETKGLEDLDVPLKMERLKLWCEDINQQQNEKRFDFVFVDEAGFQKYKPASFEQLVANFREYKE